MVAGCLVERYRDQIQKDIPEVDAVVGTGELEKILAAAGLQPPPVRTESPFVIIGSRPEAEVRAAQGRFSREAWAGESWNGAPAAIGERTTPPITQSTNPTMKTAPKIVTRESVLALRWKICAIAAGADHIENAK